MIVGQGHIPIIPVYQDLSRQDGVLRIFLWANSPVLYSAARGSPTNRRARPKKEESTMNRLLVGVLGIAGAGLWLLSGANFFFAPQRAPPSVQSFPRNAYPN